MVKTMKFFKDFEDSLEETLSAFGEKQKQTIYSYLDNCYGLNKQEIPNRIEEFSQAIDNLFGTGGKLIKASIMKALFKKIKKPIKIKAKTKDLYFEDYIQTIRITK